MTEYEVYELAMSLREYQQSIGEGVLLRIQFWVGVSFAFIAMIFIAPQRLTLGVTAFLLAVYISFSTAQVFDVRFNLRLILSTEEQEQKILADNGNATLIPISPEMQQLFKKSGVFTIFYLPALFLGVIVYASFTARKTYIVNRRESISAASGTLKPPESQSSGVS